jgi:hypothetical protein
MPTTYATAFAAHHARGSTLRPRDTTLRPRDTMIHRPTMLRAGDTMVHRPTMLRARDTTTTTRSTRSLGDFSASDRAQHELRRRDYLPILFDFAVPATRDITETVSLLARMARFIIADLTDPSSIPKELEAVVPDLAVPVQPLLEGASRPYAMFKDYWKYDWVLPVHRYEGLEPLLKMLAEKVIAPAEGKLKALEERRRMIEAELTKSQ